MAQKLYCSQGHRLGQGRGNQPGVEAGVVLMAPEAEDEFRGAEAEHAFIQPYVSSRNCMSQTYDHCNIFPSGMTTQPFGNFTFMTIVAQL